MMPVWNEQFIVIPNIFRLKTNVVTSGSRNTTNLEAEESRKCFKLVMHMPITELAKAYLMEEKYANDEFEGEDDRVSLDGAPECLQWAYTGTLHAKPWN